MWRISPAFNRPIFRHIRIFTHFYDLATFCNHASLYTSGIQSPIGGPQWDCVQHLRVCRHCVLECVGHVRAGAVRNHAPSGQAPLETFWDSDSGSDNLERSTKPIARRHSFHLVEGVFCAPVKVLPCFQVVRPQWQAEKEIRTRTALVARDLSLTD